MDDLQTQMKQAVADAAVEQIRDGMVLGLGSGSTAALMIRGLGAKMAKGELKNIVGVTTSFQGEVLAADLLSKLPSRPVCMRCAEWNRRPQVGGGCNLRTELSRVATQSWTCEPPQLQMAVATRLPSC